MSIRKLNYLLQSLDIKTLLSQLWNWSYITWLQFWVDITEISRTPQHCYQLFYFIIIINETYHLLRYHDYSISLFSAFNKHERVKFRLQRPTSNGSAHRCNTVECLQMELSVTHLSNYWIRISGALYWDNTSQSIGFIPCKV